MSTSDFQTSIETNLDNLYAVVQNYNFENKLDSQLSTLIQLIKNNKECFITVAPTCLKIRSLKNKCIYKIQTNLSTMPTGIVDRIGELSKRDLAFIFLLMLKIQGVFNLVKFTYKRSNPQAKEFTQFKDLQTELNSLIADDPIPVRIGTCYKLVDGAVNIHGVPKADFSVTLDGNAQFFISHKDKSADKSLVNSFRQYSGISKYCLGDLANHPEIIELKQQLRDGFSEAGFSLKEMRSGSYFAKEIKDETLMRAAMFGRDFNGRSSIHCVDAIMQGYIGFANTGIGYDIVADHVINNPKHTNNILHIEEEFKPHFIIMKSSNDYQGFKKMRIAIWPKNNAVIKGLNNFNKFFICKEFNSFKAI